MQTLFTGFVDNEMKYPYVLMDMEQDITNANVGFNKLLELAEDNVIKYSEPIGGGGTNYPTQTQDAVVNLWSGFNHAAPVNKPLVMKLGGMFFPVNTYTSVSGNLQLQALNLTTDSYYRINQPSDGGLIVLSKNYNNFSYSINSLPNNGAIIGIRHEYQEVYPFLSYYLLRGDGTCFFFHVTSTPMYLGRVEKNTLIYNHIGELPSNRLYALRATHAVASGTVYDAANQPSAGCRVLAYNRETGKLIGSAVSGADGRYSCHVNATKGSEIFMVCLDNAVAPDFEAQIIDRIIV